MVEVVSARGVIIIQHIHRRAVAVKGVMVKDIENVFSGPQLGVLY